MSRLGGFQILAKQTTNFFFLTGNLVLATELKT